jgi:membrane-bound serine protease (ClpP class)
VFFPGVVGGICLLLALTAMQVLPVNIGALALIALGVALLVAEAFLPTFGVVGRGRLVAFLLGSLFLFDSPATRSSWRGASCSARAAASPRSCC